MKFYRYVPSLETSFRATTDGTSRQVRLTPHIIGRTIHVKFDYTYSDATGQNMTTIATYRACQEWMDSPASKEFGIADFQLEGNPSSDKKL